MIKYNRVQMIDWPEMYTNLQLYKKQQTYIILYSL